MSNPAEIQQIQDVDTLVELKYRYDYYYMINDNDINMIDELLASPPSPKIDLSPWSTPEELPFTLGEEVEGLPLDLAVHVFKRDKMRCVICEAEESPENGGKGIDHSDRGDLLIAAVLECTRLCGPDDYLDVSGSDPSESDPFQY